MVKYKVVVNGNLISPTYTEKCLHQGDSLSHYLFILCAEGLSALLKAETLHGRLHEIRIIRRAPAISHLLFVDDSILFCKVDEIECGRLKEVLECYDMASGQAINFQKS